MSARSVHLLAVPPVLDALDGPVVTEPHHRRLPVVGIVEPAVPVVALDPGPVAQDNGLRGDRRPSTVAGPISRRPARTTGEGMAASAAGSGPRL